MKFFAQSKVHSTETVSQARVDAIIASARAQYTEIPVRPLFREAMRTPLAPSENLLDLRLEEELAYARRSLESMGDALCDDPILLMRHGVKLQTIDMLSQILGHIASVIGAADRADAVSRIGMVELHNRLTRDATTVTEALPLLVRADSNPFGGP